MRNSEYKNNDSVMPKKIVCFGISCFLCPQGRSRVVELIILQIWNAASISASKCIPCDWIQPRSFHWDVRSYLGALSLSTQEMARNGNFAEQKLCERTWLKRLAIILPRAKPAAAPNQSHSVANLIISGVQQKQLNLSPADPSQNSL